MEDQVAWLEKGLTAMEVAAVETDQTTPGVSRVATR
jgi:hypothetical protein